MGALNTFHIRAHIMKDDALNMRTRNFFKKVGVKSQFSASGRIVLSGVVVAPGVEIHRENCAQTADIPKSNSFKREAANRRSVYGGSAKNDTQRI